MKKLLIAYIMGALMTGAWAVQQANAFNATQESFESLTDGAALDVSDERTDKQWVCEDTDATLKAVAYTDEDKAYTYGTPVANTRATAWSTQKNYLSIDTGSGKPLWRTLAADGSSTGFPVWTWSETEVDEEGNPVGYSTGYVFDALVQFTGTDTAPSALADDRFVLWMKTEEDDNGVKTSTLNVICGKDIGDATLGSGVSTNLVLDAQVTEGQWARVSVKALAFDTTGSYAGFVVFIDGKVVAAADSDAYDAMFGEMWSDATAESEFRKNNRQLFPSIFTGYDVKKIGFEGSGKIDDFQILAEADAPEFTKYDASAVTTFEVSFQAIGATWTSDVAPEAFSVEAEKTIAEAGKSLPNLPAVEGYEVKGWYSDKECTIKFDDTLKITAATVLYAKYTEKVTTFEVTFAQKGLPDGTAWTAPTIDPVVSGQAISALPDAPAVDGYTASAWQYDNGTAYAAQEITEATTLYVTYTVVAKDPDPIAPGATAEFTDKAKADTWAANKDNIVIPSSLTTDAAKDTYKSYLVGTVTGDDTDGYTVTFDIDSTKEADLEAALEEVLPKVLDGTEITTAVPGFYYAVKACDTVGGEYAVKGDWAQAGDDGTVTLSVTKTEGKTAEFYKIVVQAVDPNAAK